MYVNNVCHPCYMLYNLRRAIKLYYCCVATVHKISQSYAVTQSPNSRLWGTIFFNLRWLRWKFSKTSRLSSANTHIYARTRTHAHRGALTQEYVPNEYRTENAWFLWKTYVADKIISYGWTKITTMLIRILEYIWQSYDDKTERKFFYVAVIHVHTPTSNSTEEEIDIFY